MKYEVTIGIPVYNAEKYIRLTMDSVLALVGRISILSANQRMVGLGVPVTALLTSLRAYIFTLLMRTMP